jgi:simple sugar transport system ATP-binding protein
LNEARTAPLAIEARGLVKRFGETIALDGVDVEVRAGTIHAIVGENGAGKTTLVRTLAGLVRPDAGRIAIEGVPFAAKRPADARRMGVGLVHQHFMLVPTATALENLMLGEEITRGPFLNRGAARAKFLETAERFGIDADPDARVESMSVGEMQRLEILKVLADGSRILLLDEPTAVLTPHEARALYSTIASSVEGGATVVLVTHRLGEVFEHAEDVTVLRAGRVSGRRRARETNEVELARIMVGRAPAAIDATPRAPAGEAVLRLRDCRDAPRGRERGRLRGLSLEVRAGEIVAIAGVEGNGQRELAEIVAGLRPYAGEARLAGESIVKHSPRSLRALGLAHVPGDRTAEGVIGPMTLEENLLLGRQREARFASRGVLRAAAIREYAAERLARFHVTPANATLLAGHLSGGNQQKLVFARESDGAPRLLLAVHPTRGVDIAAQEEIRSAILALRDGGAGVLLVSSDLPEVLQLADRAVVMARGSFVRTFARGEADEEAIGLAMTAA